MEENLIKNAEGTFESIKHVDENGVEFWYARELTIILQYTKWQNFEKIIDKAKISCENSDISAFEHFTEVSKTIKIQVLKILINFITMDIKDYITVKQLMTLLKEKD